MLPATLVVLDAERHIYRLVSREEGWNVDLTPMRGDVAAGAQLRDFTIDALAVPLDEFLAGSGTDALLDTVGGLEDLRLGQVRAVNQTVFVEDGLRLLRAVRLAAELGFTIEPGTAETIRAEAHRLEGVAQERVRDEFSRIMAVPGSARYLRLLDELGLLTRVLPELEEGRGVQQPKEHYWNVLDHSIETVAAMEQVLRLVPDDKARLGDVPWDEATAEYFNEEISEGRTRAVVAKIAALLHDVAKPATKSIESNGRIRFLGHPTKGAEMSQRALRRLRFSNREVKMVSGIVTEHLRPGLLTRSEEPPTRRAVYRFFRDAGDIAVDTLYLSFADTLAARGPLLEDEEWRLYAGRISSILKSSQERRPEVRPVRLIDGHDLMHEYGLEPGRRVGELLDAILESQAAGEIVSREEALAMAGRLLGVTAGAP